MAEDNPYRIPLEDLEASALVDDEDQVEEHDVTPPADPEAFARYQHLGSHTRPPYTR